MDIADLDFAIDVIDAFLWPDEEGKQRNKRERILGAATELFQRLGYRKTSIDDVAKQAGVAKGTVYLYYQNKPELLCHAVTFEERQYFESMRPLAENDLSPRERLASFIKLCIQMMFDMPLTSSLIQGNHEISVALQEIDKDFVENVNAVRADFVVHLLDKAVPKRTSNKEKRLRARILIDSVTALTTSGLINPKQADWDDYVDTLTNLLVDGLVGVDGNVHQRATDVSRRDLETRTRVRV